jgi:hypothetical protein
MDFDNRGKDRKVVVQGLGEEDGNKALCSPAIAHERHEMKNDDSYLYYSVS